MQELDCKCNAVLLMLVALRTRGLVVFILETQDGVPYEPEQPLQMGAKVPAHLFTREGTKVTKSCHFCQVSLISTNRLSRTAINTPAFTQHVQMTSCCACRPDGSLIGDRRACYVACYCAYGPDGACSSICVVTGRVWVLVSVHRAALTQHAPTFLPFSRAPANTRSVPLAGPGPVRGVQSWGSERLLPGCPVSHVSPAP